MYAQPDLHFYRDDGKIPNSKLPVVIYRQAFSLRGEKAANWLEDHFEKNHWSNFWRDEVYDYHHYHSNTHEVLGVFKGSASLHLGGEKGEIIEVEAGDIIIIPAGVGHKQLQGRDDFTVVGGYPDGRDWDVCRGYVKERPKALRQIAAVPLPTRDPLTGKYMQVWESNSTRRSEQSLQQ